jgi:hypothetical protein
MFNIFANTLFTASGRDKWQSSHDEERSRKKREARRLADAEFLQHHNRHSGLW